MDVPLISPAYPKSVLNGDAYKVALDRAFSLALSSVQLFPPSYMKLSKGERFRACPFHQQDCAEFRFLSHSIPQTDDAELLFRERQFQREPAGEISLATRTALIALTNAFGSSFFAIYPWAPCSIERAANTDRHSW